YLSDLAGMPTFVPKQPNPAPASLSTPPPEDATADQKARKPKSRVGEPSPRRDQVGTAQQEEKSTQCSFSGPIKLEAVRWLESTVQEVQCPTCGSVSKAKLKGQLSFDVIPRSYTLLVMLIIDPSFHRGRKTLV